MQPRFRWAPRPITKPPSSAVSESPEERKALVNFAVEQKLTGAFMQRTIANAVRQSAIEQGKQMAAEVGGKTSLQSFQAKQDLWTRGDALKIDVLGPEAGPVTATFTLSSEN